MLLDRQLLATGVSRPLLTLASAAEDGRRTPFPGRRPALAACLRHSDSGNLLQFATPVAPALQRMPTASASASASCQTRTFSGLPWASHASRRGRFLAGSCLPTPRARRRRRRCSCRRRIVCGRLCRAICGDVASSGLEAPRVRISPPSSSK